MTSKSRDLSLFVLRIFRCLPGVGEVDDEFGHGDCCISSQWTIVMTAWPIADRQDHLELLSSYFLIFQEVHEKIRKEGTLYSRVL